MNKINVGGHGRSPFCNGNFKSANICRTEAGLGNWSRPVSNCQNSLRAWENKTKKMNYFAISFVFNSPQTPQLRAKLWIWIIRNWPIQSVQSPATYVHRRRNRIYVNVNYHLPPDFSYIQPISKPFNPGEGTPLYKLYRYVPPQRV